MKQELLNYFNTQMLHAENVIENQSDINLFSALVNLNYSDAQNQDFCYDQELTNACYFWKFGYAYALEYAVMFECLLRSYNAEEDSILGICDLGCGSMIAAWALAYAKEKLREEGHHINNDNSLDNLSLRYVGVDVTKWSIQFCSEEDNVMSRVYPINNPRFLKDGDNDGMDIVDFFRNETWYQSYNIMCFSKVLNELPENTINQLITSISNAAQNGKFKRNEYYICISHSKTGIRYTDQNRIADRIIQAMNYNDQFDVNDRIPSVWNEVYPPEKQLAENLDDNICKYYTMESNMYFDRFNPDFNRFNVFRNADERIRNVLQGYYRNPMKNASNAVFQIIKLTRKEENNQ